MGAATPPNASAVKGATCQAIDALSANRNGLLNFRTALQNISGAQFAGIENVLAQHLLPARSPAYAPDKIEKIRQHLKACWFDMQSPTYYFPGSNVAFIQGIGYLKTLELALDGNRPIDCWWVLDHGAVDMLNFATPHQVTLIIATPRPAAGGADMRLMAARAEPTVGFSARMIDGTVQNRKLEIPER